MKRSGFGSPLLARELIELAARRRTYTVRVVYGCLFYLAVWLQHQPLLLRARTQPFALLGHGQEIFRSFSLLQAIGILIFMPALTCGAIAYEKERNSLQLLLLTRLGPWSIIFEKLVSRLIPMLTCLLLGMPLLALTYSLGGISAFELWMMIWFLFLEAVAVGSLSLACSAYSRTTSGAFIGTYLGMGVFYAFFMCTCLPVLKMASPLQGPYILLSFMSAVLVALSVGLLFAARTFLIARAFVAPRNLLLEMFHGLDRIFRDMNHITGGIVLVNDDKALPRDEPIAWRETMKKSLGTVRYLFRVLIAMEIPVLVILVFAAGDLRGRNSAFGTASGLLYITWVVSLLMIAMKGTGLISSERSRETLDVLLTTPLSGEQILREKFRALRRLLFVLSIPLLTCCLFDTFWSWSLSQMTTEDQFNYLVCGVFSIVIYLALAGWLAFWIGLRVRSQTRATVIALSLFMGWIFLPLLIPLIPSSQPPNYYSRFGRRAGFNGYGDGSEWRLLVSPQTFVTKNEAREFPGWKWVQVHFAVFGGLALLIRYNCLKRADQHLGRGRSTLPHLLTSDEAAEPSAASP